MLTKKKLVLCGLAALAVFLALGLLNLRTGHRGTDLSALPYLPTGIEGLEASIVVEGQGNRAARLGDYIQVRYYATIEDGTDAGSNFGEDEPLGFYLGRGEVIPGWDKGLVGMRVGEERRLKVSAELAYGAKGSDMIPPNTPVDYLVKLVNIR